MFDFLRKKISTWLGKEEKPARKKRREEKKTKVLKEKKTRKLKETKISAKTKKEKEKHLRDVQTESRLPPTATAQMSSSESATQKESSEKNAITQVKIEANTNAEIQEEVPEEPQKENFFTRLIKRISGAKLTQEQFDEIFMELELTLLENNVALEAVDKIREHLAQRLINKDIKKADAPQVVLAALKDSILSLLIEPLNLLAEVEKSDKPYVILFFGINGTGKTTSIATLAHYLKKNDLSCVLAAADTFRAASIEQLKTHASRLDVPIIASAYGTDPASVAFDAIAYAKKNHIQVVLIDTAGRMYTKENLLKEMEKIVRVARPNLKIFVGESITGNDA